MNATASRHRDKGERVEKVTGRKGVTIHAPTMHAQLTYSLASACGIPELSALAPPRVLGMVLSNAFGGPLPKTREPRLLVINFVRFVDTAITEYEAARHALAANVLDGAVFQAFRCFGHLENCLVTVRRAYAALDGLKRYPEVRVEKVVRRFLEAHRQPIKQGRDAVEHIDKYIVLKGLGLNGPFLPAFEPAGDAVTIAGQRVRMSDLASVLSSMAKLSEQLAHLPPAPSRAPP